MSEKSNTTVLPWANQSQARSILLSALIPASLVILFVILRLYHITTYSLWGGDIFTVIGSKMDWGGMFSYIVADIVHPPLIYILLKWWIAIGGESVLWLRLLPAVFGIGIVVPFFLLCRELNLKPTETYLALLLVAVNGYLIHYSQEVRMYSMLAFWSVCSFWLFIRYFKSMGTGSNGLLALTFINLLAIYSHYYGWLVVGMEFLYLLIWRRNILPFSLSTAFLALCFSPWAYLVIQQARSIGGLEKNLGWIPRPGPKDVLNFYSTLIGPLGTASIKALGLLLFNVPLVLWLWRIVKLGRKAETEDVIAISWLALLSFLPVALIFLVSQKFTQALWIDRYFIFVAVPYLLLLSIAVNRLSNKWIRNGLILLMALWSIGAGITDLRTNRIAWTSPQLGGRADWKSLARQLSEAETTQVGPIKVYTVPVFSKGHLTGDYAISMSLDYYLDMMNDHRFEMVYMADLKALPERVEDKHFWVAYFDIEEWRMPSAAKLLTENGYIVDHVFSYRHLGNQILLVSAWRK
jgi:4-amino-4-deoxy-L-arabinose transferase-like glycosyltransferase